MRFRFCGDLDVPDWILKEITLLSKISAIKIRLVAAEIVTHLITGDELNYEKVLGHLAVNNFDSGEVKAVIASLHFIINNSAKYAVAEETLANELTQLGLPKEHSEGIGKVYSKSRNEMRAKFDQSSLQLDKLDSVGWRVDYILASSSLQDLNAPSVQLKLDIKKNSDGESKVEPVSFEMNADKFRVFLNELKAARALMEGI